jgi:hypothetical protein
LAQESTARKYPSRNYTKPEKVSGTRAKRQTRRNRKQGDRREKKSYVSERILSDLYAGTLLWGLFSTFILKVSGSPDTRICLILLPVYFVPAAYRRIQD